MKSDIDKLVRKSLSSEKNKKIYDKYYKCTCDTVEEWRYHPKYNNYLISNKGKVIGLTYKKFLTPELLTGYYRFVLNSRKKKYAHILVSETFMENDTNKTDCVDHIDRNKLHNCVSNLRFATYSENAKNRKKTSYDRGYHINQYSKDNILINEFKSMREAFNLLKLKSNESKFREHIKEVKNKNILYLDYYWRDTNTIDNEEWKTITLNNQEIKVSSIGRFEWKNGNISFGNKKADCKYLDYNDIRAHIIVATAFIPKKSENYKEVNHIDGNTLNNKVSNLEWITGSNNSHHAVTLQTNKTKKAIKQIDPKTGIVLNIFESVRCAHKYVTEKLNKEISVTALENRGQKNSDKHYLALNKYAKSVDYIWKYVKDCKENEFKEDIDKTHKSNINQYDETRCISMFDNVKLIHIFKNIEEAVNFMDVNIGKLRNVLNGIRHTTEGFKWKWIEKSYYNKELYIDLCKQQLKSENYKIKKNKTVVCDDMTNDKTFEFDIKAEKDDEFYYILCVSMFKINEYKQFIYDIFKNLEFDNKKKHHIYIYYYDKDKYVSKELYIK